MKNTTNTVDKNWQTFLNWVREQYGMGMSAHLEFLDFAAESLSRKLQAKESEKLATVKNDATQTQCW